MDVDEIIDGLYALPAAEFTAARNAAAKELRQAGLRAEAARVAELRKPTAAAEAVNRLVRSKRKEVEWFLEAASKLRDAQAGGRNIEAATKTERELLVRLVQAGGADVRQSLQAAAVDQVAAAQLLEGRLTHELDPPGFGTLFDHVKPLPAKSAARGGTAKTEEPPKPDDRAERARLAEAKKGLAAARTVAQRAEREWNRARAELDLAQAAVDKAQAALERAQSR